MRLECWLDRRKTFVLPLWWQHEICHFPLWPKSWVSCAGTSALMSPFITECSGGPRILSDAEDNSILNDITPLSIQISGFGRGETSESLPNVLIPLLTVGMTTLLILLLPHRHGVNCERILLALGYQEDLLFPMMLCLQCPVFDTTHFVLKQEHQMPLNLTLSWFLNYEPLTWNRYFSLRQAAIFLIKWTLIGYHRLKWLHTFLSCHRTS